MYWKKQKLLSILTTIILSVLLCTPAMATNTDYDSTHPENLNIADLQAVSAILIEKNLLNAKVAIDAEILHIFWTS